MRFFLALMKTSIRSSISLKMVFLIEAFLMIGNNFIFLAIWWLFFNQFQTVGGWSFHDMIVLNCVVSGGYGISRICFGGIKDFSKTIIMGNLDIFMTQPKDILLHIVCSKSQSKGFGHLITAILLFAFDFQALAYKLPLILLFILGGALVFTAFAVIVHSLPFWFGAIDAVTNKYSDSILVFVKYPVNIYSGVFQLMMFTLFPAGIIGFLPVEIVRAFTWTYFFGFIFSVVGFIALAYFIFYRGLRCYESGNQFGVRF
jgi:ABC-2 type transport system permease protein